MSRAGRGWHDPRVAVRIAIVRGVFAIVFGVVLVAEGGYPGSGLLNFMGLYWLTTGLATLGWALAAERPRRTLPIVAGALGVVAGTVVLVQSLIGTPSLTFVLVILGVVIALTGVVHLLGGFELAADLSGRRWRPGIPLGILEVGLGFSLALTAGYIGTVGLWLAGAWAMLTGTVLISDALRVRRRLLKASG